MTCCVVFGRAPATVQQRQQHPCRGPCAAAITRRVGCRLAHDTWDGLRGRLQGFQATTICKIFRNDTPFRQMICDIFRNDTPFRQIICDPLVVCSRPVFWWIDAILSASVGIRAQRCGKAGRVVAGLVTHTHTHGGRLIGGSIGTAPIWCRPDEILSIAHIFRDHVVLIQPSDRQYNNIHGLRNGKTVANRPRRGGGLTAGSISVPRPYGVGRTRS